MANYYFKYSIKNSKNLWKETQTLEIQNMLAIDCNCGAIKCSGKYIKTRDYQNQCLHGIINTEKYMDEIKYQIISPNKEFPLWREYEKQFKIDENTIFTFENTIYTNHTLPDHLIEHEKMHIMQQNKIGADMWVFKYLNDKEFRLSQEVEAYRYQLMQVKDKNAKVKLRNEIVKHLSGEMYGNMVTEEEANNLLKV